MAAKNDITGDSIQSKTNSTDYLDGWERIFGHKVADVVPPTDKPMESTEKEGHEILN